MSCLGIGWPEPEERRARGRPPVGGGRERPGRQQERPRQAGPGSRQPSARGRRDS